jgi:phosphoribosylglycinamide formyltransferase-1
MKYNKWAVFVSQTGSEVVNISETLGITPGYLFTNNPNKLAEKTLRLIEENGIVVIKLPFRPTGEDYKNVIFKKVKLITLHGYLRILPASFIDRFEGKIYNGHPGLIDKYPELKGKDPQVRAWEGNYDWIGSVIHKVTAGVDEGKIEHTCSTINRADSLDSMYELLKNTSFTCWVTFLFRNNLVPLDGEVKKDLQFVV